MIYCGHDGPLKAQWTTHVAWAQKWLA